MENGRVEGAERQYVEGESTCSKVGVAGRSCSNKTPVKMYSTIGFGIISMDLHKEA